MLCALLLIAVSSSAAGRDSHPLRHNLMIDASVTLIGASYWVATETAFKKQLAPTDCRWCDRNGAGEDTRLGIDLLGAQLRLADPYLDEMDMASNVVAFGVLPAAVFAVHAVASYQSRATNDLALNALFVAQALVLALSLNQTVKFLAGRARPFAFRGASFPGTRHPEDENLSFFSGHATFAFALVAATATVAELRGYELSPWIWRLGLPLATGVALMRLSADKHYATDVLVGAAVGTAFGIFIPRGLHPRVANVDVAINLGPRGLSASARF